MSLARLPMAQMFDETKTRPVTHWQQWLEHPERLLVRRIVFQVHLWVGAAAAALETVVAANEYRVAYEQLV